MRNSLSSHASERGRRLAEERSKNQQLAQRVRELERTVALMRRGEHDHGGTTRSCQEDDFDCRRAASRTENQLASNSDKEDVTVSSDPSTGELPGQACYPATGIAPHGMAGNHTNITKTTSVRSHQMNHDRRVGPIPAHDHETMYNKMREYQELISAFHAEQASHGDIDGEDLLSRDDVLWLLQELKWRFDDLLLLYATERDEPPRESDCREEDQDNVGNSQMKSTLASDTHAPQHRESHSNKESMTCHEQTDLKSRKIHSLEAKIEEQKERIAKMEQQAQQEREQAALAQEGTAARVQYLEGMLRASQAEAREARTPRGEDDGANGARLTWGSPSTPIFLRDLTAAAKPLEAVRAAAPAPLEGDAGGDTRHRLESMAAGTPRMASPSEAEVAQLHEEMAALGDALAESECGRAAVLEEFQRERKKYMVQYKRVSDILKHLLYDERIPPM